jgi:hypothetical protein
MDGLEPTAERLPDDTNPARSASRAGVAIVALLLAGTLAAVMMMGGDDVERVATEGGERRDVVSSTTTIPPTTTPSSTTSTSVVATTSAPAIMTTSTAAPPSTTTTTARPRKPAFTITPSSGPAGTQAEASGTGCTGTDAGIELTMSQPSGEPYTGDGAAAMPDGSWRVPFSFPAGGSKGTWTMKAACKANGGALVVDYEPQTFSVT